MQRARAMEGRRSEDELRDGLPTRPAHRDTLRAARSAHGHLQRHQLRAHDPIEPARSAATPTRARAPAPSTTTPARARPPAPARAAPARAGARRATAGRAAEAAEARQEEAAAPRPVRPRPTTTAAAAARDTTAAAGARAGTGSRSSRQRAGSSASRSRALRPGCGPAGVLPVHAVAAAEVGGDAEAARVLLRGVPVQLPDAGPGGHLQPRHGRQQAHHHLQRGEPQRLRHRLSAVGGRRPLPNCAGEESGSLLDVLSGRCCTDKEKGIVGRASAHEKSRSADSARTVSVFCFRVFSCKAKKRLVNDSWRPESVEA